MRQGPTDCANRASLVAQREREVAAMKVGIRTPSLRKSIAARTSWKRRLRHDAGLKAPRGYGWLTDPKKAAYNRVYNRTTFSVWRLLKGLVK
jgi:hypothetical protein